MLIYLYEQYINEKIKLIDIQYLGGKNYEKEI